MAEAFFPLIPKISRLFLLGCDGKSVFSSKFALPYTLPFSELMKLHPQEPSNCAKICSIVPAPKVFNWMLKTYGAGRWLTDSFIFDFLDPFIGCCESGCQEILEYLFKEFDPRIPLTFGGNSSDRIMKGLGKCCNNGHFDIAKMLICKCEIPLSAIESVLDFYNPSEPKNEWLTSNFGIPDEYIIETIINLYYNKNTVFTVRDIYLTARGFITDDTTAKIKEYLAKALDEELISKTADDNHFKVTATFILKYTHYKNLI
jgi:hypothetical protein